MYFHAVGHNNHTRIPVTILGPRKAAIKYNQKYVNKY